MKIKITIIVFIIIGFFLYVSNPFQKISDKQKHTELIDNSPIQKQLLLSKKERKLKALPPNKYFEQEYLNEMDPKTGKTYPEKLFQLQNRLNKNRNVPGATNNSWVERGPDNVPGRTRAVMYDPNDTTHKRVFAGAVSGGLWVIDNIESATDTWQRVNIPENLTVSSITYDVNDSNIFYVGTGESFAYGNVNGNGVWKSTDGGVTWNHVFGGSSGETTVISNANLTINTGSLSGNVYAATQTTNFGPSLTTISGELVIVNDGTANPTEGCSPLTNSSSVNGKIAVIDRATCLFTEKVKNAQNAGAIAAIILNNVSSFPFNMAGDDTSITIPAVMMGQSDGLILKNAITNGTITATLNPVTTDLPAGIILIPGKFHVNDIVTRNNNGSTEIYAAISESMHTSSSNLLGGEIGLYKSIDEGNTWQKINLPLTSSGHPYAPNDLLVTSDNKIWVTTTNSWSFGDGGGRVFSSSDGTNFTQKYSYTNGKRTQIAASSTDPDKLYLLMDGNSNSYLKKTTNGFNSVTNLNIPSGFNSQRGYNLTLTVDPLNDNNIYIGGNYVYKSSNSGGSFNKITHYYSDTSPGSYVHVDIHTIVLHPTEINKGILGCDGGVYYINSSGTMFPRDKDYNTIQLYKGAIGQSTSNKRFIGGAQDNGTIMINNASAGINSASSINGGDGMYCFIDKDDQYMITSIYYNSYYKEGLNGNSSSTIVYNQNEGDFVNVAEIDDNLDILYSNASVKANDGSITTAAISRFSNLNGSILRFDITDDFLTRPVSAMKISPYTTNFSTLFVGTDIGDIFKVTRANGGHPIWTDLTPEPYVMPFRGSISSINFGANENEIMVTFHNYGVVNVFFTEDGGVTWQNKEGDLPDLPVKDILMNPLLNDEVIIATDLGVWKTTNFKDANPHWERSQNGMQNVKVTSFDLRTADNTILASTYGRGLFTGQFTSYPASTDSFVKNNKITIYPTISNGNITLTASDDLTKSNIHIFDINGRSVYKTIMDINNSKKYLSLNLDKGVYFVNITNKNLKESHKIIIK